MKFLWTNFRSLLAKFRTASLLNIAGLAVALAVAIVVAIQVKWDFTYDRGYTNAKRIFTYERYQQTDGTAFMTLNMQWPQKMLDEIPEVEAFTLVWSPREMPVDRMEADGSYVQYRINHTPVRADFFKVFTPEIIAGETTGLFTADDKIMISRKTAEKIFGTANVVGQTLYNHEDKKPVTIAAVYEDFPENQTIKNGIFSYLEYDDREGNYSYNPYFLIDPASADKVEEIINSAAFIGQEGRPDETRSYTVYPYADFGKETGAVTGVADESALKGVVQNHLPHLETGCRTHVYDRGFVRFFQ